MKKYFLMKRWSYALMLGVMLSSCEERDCMDYQLEVYEKGIIVWDGDREVGEIPFAGKPGNALDSMILKDWPEAFQKDTLNPVD